MRVYTHRMYMQNSLDHLCVNQSLCASLALNFVVIALINHRGVIN